MLVFKWCDLGTIFTYKCSVLKEFLQAELSTSEPAKSKHFVLSLDSTYFDKRSANGIRIPGHRMVGIALAHWTKVAQ